MVHHELRKLQSDASWTSEDETREVDGFGKTPGVPRFGQLCTFMRRGLFFPLALLAFATRLCRFAISGWLSQAVKSTNANNSSLWHSWHETEVHVLHENCDLLMHTLEMRMHQRLPDCHQTVHEILGHLSEGPSCMLILRTRHHSRQYAGQHRPHSIHRHHLRTHQFVDPRHSRKLFDAGRGFSESRQVRIVHCCQYCFRFPGLRVSCCQRIITPLCTEGIRKMSECPTVANAFSRSVLVVFAQTVFADLGL